MRRGVGHAACSARGTESATLTRESYQPLPAAVVAANAEKAPAEEATVEEGAELALDEAGNHPTLFSGGGEKGLEVVLHDAVENGVLGLAPLVRERLGEVVSDEGLARHGRKPMRVACRLPNVRCGREKVAKGPGVLSRSRSRCDDSFTSLPPPDCGSPVPTTGRDLRSMGAARVERREAGSDAAKAFQRTTHPAAGVGEGAKRSRAQAASKRRATPQALCGTASVPAPEILCPGRAMSGAPSPTPAAGARAPGRGCSSTDPARDAFTGCNVVID
jgi:hypothetical protein